MVIVVVALSVGVFCVFSFRLWVSFSLRFVLVVIAGLLVVLWLGFCGFGWFGVIACRLVLLMRDCLVWTLIWCVSSLFLGLTMVVIVVACCVCFAVVLVLRRCGFFGVSLVSGFSDCGWCFGWLCFGFCGVVVLDVVFGFIVLLVALVLSFVV